jgi:hypothetical protein
VGARRGTRQERAESGESGREREPREGPRKGMRLFVGAKGFSATEKIADLYEVYAAIVDEAVAADQPVPVRIASP